MDALTRILAYPHTRIPLVLYREFFTPVVNGYIFRAGLTLLLFGTAWLLRHNRKISEQYGTSLVMLGMLRAEDVPKLRSAHRMGLLLYFLSLCAAGWFGWYCNDIATAKPAAPENPLKDLRTTTPTTPLDPGKLRNPLAPPGKGKGPTTPAPSGSPYAPMPERR